LAYRTRQNAYLQRGKAFPDGAPRVVKVPTVNSFSYLNFGNRKYVNDLFPIFHLQQVIWEIGKRPFSYFRFTEPTNRKTEKDIHSFCIVV